MYKSLEQALLDLEKAGMLKRIHAEVREQVSRRL